MSDWTALFIAAAVLIPTAATASEWRHAGGDPLATCRLDGPGGMTGNADALAGATVTLPIEQTNYQPQLLLDLTGDGDVEVIAPFQQRVAAFDPTSGDLVWATPPLGVTHVLPPFDPLCSGSDSVILALNANMGGGLHLLDRGSGAVIWSFTELDSVSGVDPSEITIADLDGDGCAELAFAAFLNDSADVYVVDLSTADGVARVARGTLSSSYQLTTRLAAGDYDGDGVANEIVIYERESIDFKRVCGAGDGGECDEVDGSLCLCDVALFTSLYTPGAFPQPITVNPDGGADEVLVVHDHGTFERGLGLLTPAPALAADDASLLAGWYYDYSASSTRVLGLPSPVDLDGDGAQEVVVTLFDAAADETDWSGAAVDDGVSNPLGFSVAVFDLLSGALLASVDDRYALGLSDLDGDGSSELVTATTSQFTFSGGTVDAYTLQCAGTVCSLDSAWTSPFGAVRFPAAYDDLGFPPRGLPVMASTGGDAVLLWDDEDLVSVVDDGVGGGVESGRVTLATDDRVAMTAADADLVMVAWADGEVSALDASLTPLGPEYRPRSQGVARIHAVRLADTDARATLIVDGLVFASTVTPTDPSDADASLGGQLILATDVDGDGFTDLISYEARTASASFVLRRHESAGSGVIEERWAFHSTSDPTLAGYGMETLWNVNAHDWSGDGVADVVIHVRLGNLGRLMTLDGATGSVSWDATTNARPAYYAPLVPADVTGPSGFGTPDGVVDLVRPTLRHLTAWEVGSATPAVEQLTTDFNSQWATGDLDGDGLLDYVTALTGRLNRAQIETWTAAPTFQKSWGPITSFGAPPDVEQGIALAELDAVAGLDVVYISSAGRVDALSGADGSALPGFPLYLADGAGSSAPSFRARP